MTADLTIGRLQAEAVKWLTRALIACAAVLALEAVWHVIVQTSQQSMMLEDDKSGIWAVLADDVAHGTLYRPPLGPLGYGGTRYMWFHPLLVAGFTRLGLGIYAAEVIVNLLAGVGVMLGAYTMVRRAGLDRWIAFACVGMVLCCSPFEYALVTFSSDTLSVALGMCGFALALDEDGQGSRRSRILGMVLVGVAFAAKQTALVYAGSLGLLFLWRKEWKRAGLLTAIVGGIVVVTIGISLTASVATTYGPLSVKIFQHISLGERYGIGLGMMRDFAKRDPITIVVAACALWRACRRDGRDVYLVLWVSSVLAVTVIFIHPGAWWNHMIEPTVIGCVLVARELHARRALLVRAAMLAILGLTVYGWFMQSRFYRSAAYWGPTKERVAPLLAELARRAPSGPILAEHPILPLLAGQRPFLVDPMTLRYLVHFNEATRKDFDQRLTSRGFSSIVLVDDPEANAGWYDTDHMGEGFACGLLSNYTLADEVGIFRVYVPAETPTRAAVCDRKPATP